MTNEETDSRAPPAFSEQRQFSEPISHNPQIGKDIWDKFSAVSTFLSGVLIAAIGLLFTYLHNEREGQRNANLKTYETRVAETQTFEKFIQYLNSTKEEYIILGITGISSLNKELGGRILVHFRAHGTDLQKKVALTILDERKVNFFNNWNTAAVENAPQKRRPALFRITQPYIIIDIRHYHYFRIKKIRLPGPAGEKPETIILRHNDGTEFGPWVVRLTEDQKDWYCVPNVVLPPGQYEIIDSDPDTWSLNAESKYVGMSVVWGFALE
jgi:hypothetical protein